MKHKKYLLLLIIPVLVLIISRTFSLTYTHEIKSVEIQSNDYNNPGSWHIDKSAEWTSFGKARVTFDVNTIIKSSNNRNKDVIYVIDISGSMAGDKLNRAKEDAIDLTNYLLSDSNNNVALITFDSNSQIVSGFSNNKNQMVDYINNLSTTGCTNYNAGLLNIETVMENYVRDENKDLVVLFLTDGYPNEDTPNQVSTYQMLKDKYPYMTINGIQYEMGKDIIQEIIDISDYQYVANQETLNNVLFNATIVPLAYENFVIEDYINGDYFYLDSVNDIKVPFGTVTVENGSGGQKVVWNLGDNFITGNNAKMNINLKIKEEYHNTVGLYPTNSGEKIISKLPEETETTINSELTPVLKNIYDVIYDTNPPMGCSLPSIDKEEYMVYQVVNVKQEQLNCLGYIFKGWKIDTFDNRDIKMMGDNTFIMPPHNITIRGTWTKQDIDKTMNGTIYEKMTLYKVLEREYQNGTYAKKYTGSHQDSIDNNGNKNIYYYYSNKPANSTEILEKRMNVIFANQCWQMIRTTDTGGVKLLYNGEPENGMCLNTRGKHIGYSNKSNQSLSGTYYYGSDYNYDTQNDSFSLSGNVESIEITSSNASGVIPTLVGKYTCKKNNLSDSCSEVYLIDSYKSGTTARTIKINANSNYSQFGTVEYNETYDSPAYVGYMYNDDYIVKRISNTYYIYNYTSIPINSSWSYSSEIDYGNIVPNRYSLIDPQPVTDLSDYNELLGKYVESGNGLSSVYYIVKVDGTNVYYRSLTGGDLNISMIMGDSYIDNNDGTYTITNEDETPVSTVSYIDWYNSSDRSVYAKKYVCDGLNSTCTDLKHISTDVQNYYYYYWGVSKKYKYAESIEYIDGSYTLTGDIKEVWDAQKEADNGFFNTHHYTCLNNIETCSPSVYFINSYSTGSLYYATLNNVNNIEEALINLLNVDTNEKKINTKNSMMKTAVEAWYKKYIYNDFDSFVEDTVYCNDRSVRDTGGWSENGNVTGYLQFKEYVKTNDLSCSNETDRFSIYNDKAKLTYKVGLITHPEITIMVTNSSTFLITGQDYWLLSPYYFGTTWSDNLYVNTKGYISHYAVTHTFGVRPVISLKPDVEFYAGDGSMENPYVVDTSS